MWLVFFLSALGCAVATCLSTWAHFEESPTVISMEHNYMDWQIIMPAAFICPIPKNDDAMIAESKKLADEAGLDEDRVAAYLYSLVNATILRDTADWKTFEEEDAGLTKKYSRLELAYRARPNLTHDRLNEINEVLVDAGFCHLYNSVQAKFLRPSIMDNAVRNTSLQTVTFFNSIKKILINAPSHKIYSFLQSTSDTVDTTTAPYFIPMLATVVAHMKSVIIYASEDLNALTVEQRKCRLDHEVGDIPTEVYSYSFCRMNCRMKYVQQLCGCLPYYYHYHKPELKECDWNGMACVQDHSEAILHLRNIEGKTFSCTCISACNEQHFYLGQEDRTVYGMAGSFPSSFQFDVSFFPTVRLRRDILFTVIDLLVAFGGAVSLFLGVSLLSLVEIIYFLVVRLFVDLCIRK